MRWIIPQQGLENGTPVRQSLVFSVQVASIYGILNVCLVIADAIKTMPITQESQISRLADRIPTIYNDTGTLVCNGHYGEKPVEQQVHLQLLLTVQTSHSQL